MSSIPWDRSGGAERRARTNSSPPATGAASNWPASGGLRSIAFPAISTGVFGVPARAGREGGAHRGEARAGAQRAAAAHRAGALRRGARQPLPAYGRAGPARRPRSLTPPHRLACDTVAPVTFVTVKPRDKSHWKQFSQEVQEWHSNFPT